MNTVKSYRVLIGLTQKQMAEKLCISEGQYREKENGKFLFNQRDMKKFMRVVREVNKNVTYEEIFF